MRGNSHVRCEAGEKAAITSKPYLSLFNALSKRVTEDSKYLLEGDLEPMHKAVAFLPKIVDSKITAAIFEHFEEIYKSQLDAGEKDSLVQIEAAHVDGSMNAAERKTELDKLRDTPTDGKICRIITNVRCLSEGVDVPSLDAVIFLSPKKSTVDIVQAVGRALRKFEGKKFGYIIVPIIASAQDNPNTKDYYAANNEKYRTINEVIQALKAHDDAMDADIERLNLGVIKNLEKFKPVRSKDYHKYSAKIPFEIFCTTLIGKVIATNGNRNYWWLWASKVSVIVARHTEKISELVAKGGAAQFAFQKFLDYLRKNINPTISQKDAIDMLAQHLVSRPVFEALFENYSFAQSNPVSKSMSEIISHIDRENLDKDRAELEKFYDEVRIRCRNMGDAKNRQRIIVNLYDNFFRQALPKTVQQLGIVYTPPEVVDFILHSVSDVLKEYFHRDISDEGVHIIDPFAGTGTFLARLIQSGLIRPNDFLRKFQKELHANEIVLLAYYIAAINIEFASYQFLVDSGNFLPADATYDFPGICLTDTFQSFENYFDKKTYILGTKEPLSENLDRINDQLNTNIEIIIGNPPYSVGQKSANDNAQNIHYEHLEQRIQDTYAKGTSATNKNALYDSYIKAFRWASDRIADTGGIIGFVTNAGWLDGAAMDGLRNCFVDDFTDIFIFNLRGNQRTQGETSRREGGKIFGSGSRAPIAITILVKNPAVSRRANIHYLDIGDYLSREDKLARIVEVRSVRSEIFKDEAETITPNSKGDWINQRGDSFDSFIPLGDKKDKNNRQTIFHDIYSKGISTSRDAWSYNFSRAEVAENMAATIDFYNSHSPEDNDSTKIVWARTTVNNKERGIKGEFDAAKIVESMYRPFCREYLYYDKYFCEMTYQIPKVFPTGNEKNLLICIAGVGANKNFSVLITDKIIGLDFIEKVQCFPLYWYESPAEQRQGNLFGYYYRRDGVTDWILAQAILKYGEMVTKADIFYYVYGFLHVPAYRERFASELKKTLPRIILVERAAEFWQLSRAGRELAELHLNYEKQEAPACVEVLGAESGDFRVKKLRFNKEHTEIIYNEKIKIVGIPARANEYVVNGRSPLEWIVERYQIKIDKASGIANDPNDWCAEQGKPRYILDLILSCITVSLKTLDIVESLPEIKFD